MYWKKKLLLCETKSSISAGDTICKIPPGDLIVYAEGQPFEKVSIGKEMPIH